MPMALIFNHKDVWILSTRVFLSNVVICRGVILGLAGQRNTWPRGKEYQLSDIFFFVTFSKRKWMSSDKSDNERNSKLAVLRWGGEKKRDKYLRQIKTKIVLRRRYVVNTSALSLSLFLTLTPCLSHSFPLSLSFPLTFSISLSYHRHTLSISLTLVSHLSQTHPY